MKKNALIIILIILILGLTGFIVCDKFIINNQKEDKTQNIQDVENNTNEVEDKSIEIVDYINYSIDKSRITNDCVDHGVEIIRIPMLNSDKPGAIELNNKIKKDFQIYIDASKRTKEEALNSDVGYAINYSYEEYENYISIKMVGGSGVYCGTSPRTYKSYYTYDIKNDKYLNNDELLKLANVTKEDLIKSVKADLISKYSEFQTNDYVQTVTDDLNNGLYDIYISYDGLIIIEIIYEPFTLPLTYFYEI